MQNQLQNLLLDILDGEKNIIYVDYPVYLNVGDLAIYHGTQRCFERLGVNILGSWSFYNFSFPKLANSTIIFCQGGGNFGDLYFHQKISRKKWFWPILKTRLSFFRRQFIFKSKGLWKIAKKY